MILARFAALSLLLTVGAACSGSTASIDNGPDGGASDGGSSGDGASGCLTREPVEGSACSPGQTVCESGDPCCRGYAWLCDRTTRTWQKAGLGCACIVDAGLRDAGYFACGDKTCAPNEFCTTAGGGVQLPDAGSNTTFTCTPIPPACAATPTCACLTAVGADSCGNCSETSGHLQISCLYP